MANHQSSCTHVHLLGHHFVSSLMNGVPRDFVTRTGLKSGTLRLFDRTKLMYTTKDVKWGKLWEYRMMCAMAAQYA